MSRFTGFKGLLARKVIAAVAGIGLVAGASLVYGVQTVASGQPASFTIQKQLSSRLSRPSTSSSSAPVNYQTAKVSGGSSCYSHWITESGRHDGWRHIRWHNEWEIDYAIYSQLI